MKQTRAIILAAAAFAAIGASAAFSGKVIEESGAISCVIDKWDEKEPEKGRKLVDYAARCVLVPDDPALAKATEACVGKFDYKPDSTWTASGTCTDTVKGGDQRFLTWEEGSQMKAYTYAFTGGTGAFQGVSGGGTYSYENLTDTLTGGRYKGRMERP
ncbi:MAG: hypothetical protein ACT4N2_11290 [Hyphomicrobium sp.]